MKISKSIERKGEIAVADLQAKDLRSDDSTEIFMESNTNFASVFRKDDNQELFTKKFENRYMNPKVEGELVDFKKGESSTSVLFSSLWGNFH